MLGRRRDDSERPGGALQNEATSCPSPWHAGHRRRKDAAATGDAQRRQLDERIAAWSQSDLLGRSPQAQPRAR